MPSTPSVFCLKISRLWRGDRREMTTIGLEIDQWRAVNAVKATHQNDVPFDADKFSNRRAERVGPHWRPQGKGAVSLGIARRTLMHEIASECEHQ